MTKIEMNKAIADIAGVPSADVDKVVNALVGTITDELLAGNKVSVNGLGIFEVREKAARQGVNPRTGEKITIDACKSVGFKVTKSIKDKVNA